MSAGTAGTQPDGALPTTVEAMIRHRLSVALGGARGAVELALPTAAFVVLWVVTENLRTSVFVALGVAVLLGAVRLIQRSSLQQVMGAVVATGIAALFAMRSGRAEDAFLPGILLSALYFVLMLVSIVARWPALGFLVGAGDPRAQEDPFAWRRDPAIVRVCQRLTWILVGMYVIRLGIMVPLYFAGNIAALGVAKIVLGWPLWLGALGVMATLLMKGETPLARADSPSEPTTGTASEAPPAS